MEYLTFAIRFSFSLIQIFLLILSKVQVFAIFAAVVLVVILFFAPNNPPLKEKTSSLQEGTEEDIDSKLNLAISYVQEGKDPMKGIMILREILEKDSNNIKAHFFLGVFSIQSGQWEKARQRFLKVLELDGSETEAYFYLAQANKSLGDTAKAIENFEKYKNFIQDENRLDEVQSSINELKK